MAEEVEKIVRYKCRKCGTPEEVRAGLLFTKVPNGWRRVEGALLCSKHVREFERMFSKWLGEKNSK